MYLQKGYNVQETSPEEKNLFKVSPLLLEDNKINDYYKFHSAEDAEKDKNKLYIEKLTGMITDKQIDFEKNNSENQQKLIKKKNTIFNCYQTTLLKQFNAMYLSGGNFREECSELSDYNKKLRKLIQEQRETNKKRYKKASNMVETEVSESFKFGKNLPDIERSRNFNKMLKKNFDLISSKSQQREFNQNSSFIASKYSSAEDNLTNFETLNTANTAVKTSEPYNYKKTDNSFARSVRRKFTFNSQKNINPLVMNSTKKKIENNDKRSNKTTTKNFIKEITSSRAKFLNYFYEQCRNRTILLQDVQFYMSEYSKKYLGYSENEIQKILSKHLDAASLYNLIKEIQIKVEKVDFDGNLKGLSKEKVKDEPLTIEEISVLNEKIGKLHFELLKNLNRVKLNIKD